MADIRKLGIIQLDCCALLATVGLSDNIKDIVLGPLILYVIIIIQLMCIF